MDIYQRILGLFVFLFFLSLFEIEQTSHAIETYSLDEIKLIDLAREDSPKSKQIALGRWQAEVASAIQQEQFQSRFVGIGSYQNSKEKGIASFVPQFGPTHLLSLGIEKKTKFGLTASLGAFTDQRSTVDGAIDRATRTGVQAKIVFDLWRDFWGKVSRAKLDNLNLRQRIEQTRSDQLQASFELELRKLYWALVANEESAKVSQELIHSAERQLKDARARLANSVSDEGEVARWAALLAAREGSLTSIGFQRKAINRQLKEMLPGLLEKEISLAPYDLEKTVGSVLMCAKKIAEVKDVPWSATSWDEVTDLLDQEYAQQEKISANHSGLDLQLESQLQMSGVDQGTSESYSDFRDKGKTGYTVGVRLVVPIGEEDKKAEDILKHLDRDRYFAEKQNLMGKIRSQHEEIGGLIWFLQKSMSSAESNSQNLKKSIAVMAKKYRQARVPLSALIADEESLFQSLLSEINVKLTVINTLLDYFQVFNQFPCEINRIEK